VIMSRMQKAGHHPLALIGGATTMIGDPTGKTDMRKMLTREEIDYNAECFRHQMRRMVEFGEGESKAEMVNNADWILPFNYMDFLREVGVHFSVNRMLTAECFKSRLEGKGLSFMEFNYMLLQSYDFLHLFREKNCMLQLGGDDQWSNIINGADLIRRVEQKPAYGMTFTLLTTSEGKKMGKTEKGAVWLDPNKTSPFEFFQYWRNIDDNDVVRCMKLLTFVPLDEIEEMEKLDGSHLNPVKERLAHEITTMVHGKEEADKALAASHSLFGAGADSEHVPTTALTSDDFSNGEITVLDLLLKTKLVPSKAEGRRVIEQGGLSINDEKITELERTFTQKTISEADFIIKKGKKTYHRVKA
ncbi:MAG: tyrosine--tRNA ligase, partial [Angelakisella sp.]